MSWRELIASVGLDLGELLRDDRTARTAALVCLAVLLALSVVAGAMSRRRARLPASPREVRGLDHVQTDLGDWGVGLARPPAGSGGAQVDGSASWPIDRMLPRKMAGTLLFAAAVGLSLWLLGLCLAPRLSTFLAAPEWHFQPFYMAAHIVALRLFVRVYTNGFERGVGYLDVPRRQVRTLVERVLGAPGALAAMLVALPFIALDFLYLFSDRYARQGGPDTVLPIDYLMWGIWSVEWFLNAFIWVVLVGFLVKTWWVLDRYRFRASVEIVLHDKHYKPFLQMGAQGASIVLAFTAVTVAYIWYTGGELTDYVGLTITALLLVASFVPSWLLLKRKISRAVADETLAMRHLLAEILTRAEGARAAGEVRGTDARAGDSRAL
ncbi:MAG: hypothetical protein AB7O57_13645, partial [Hyphomicrobiaceae bacterium]